MPARRRKQLLIRLRSAECNSNLNWRSRVARAQRRCSLRNFVTAEYFQPRRSRWLRGESIKGKSFSFTSAVARVQTFSFFPFLSFASRRRRIFFYLCFTQDVTIPSKRQLVSATLVPRYYPVNRCHISIFRFFEHRHFHRDKALLLRFKLGSVH